MLGPGADGQWDVSHMHGQEEVEKSPLHASIFGSSFCTESNQRVGHALLLGSISG